MVLIQGSSGTHYLRTLQFVEADLVLFLCATRARKRTTSNREMVLLFRRAMIIRRWEGSQNAPPRRVTSHFFSGCCLTFFVASLRPSRAAFTCSTGPGSCPDSNLQVCVSYCYTVVSVTNHTGSDIDTGTTYSTCTV